MEFKGFRKKLLSTYARVTASERFQLYIKKRLLFAYAIQNFF